MTIIYSILIRSYGALLWLVASFHEKANLLLRGRRNTRNHLASSKILRNDVNIWIHCASVGEFEQAKPLIHALKAQHKNLKFIVSFFSPSGYENCKKSEQMDHVFYMLADTEKNASFWIDHIQPRLAIFIKYEFWYHHLKALHQRGIPCYLVSAVFRKNQIFFKNYGGFFRNMLPFYTKLFVQDQQSRELLHGISPSLPVEVCGDTRYDRVSSIATQHNTLPLIEKFVENSPVFIVGSSWPADEKIIFQLWKYFPASWKMIMAPHEVNKAHLSQIISICPYELITYSQLEQNKNSAARILLIDNIGMLSRLYAYGQIAFIGGGFAKSGIHNTLEAAVYGLPIFMGPHYGKFVEARALVEKGFAFPIRHLEDAVPHLQALLESPEKLESLQKVIKTFVSGQTGATACIMQELLPVLKHIHSNKNLPIPLDH